MLLGALVDAFIALRSASGLYLGRPEVVACGVEACRFFGGWADFVDPLGATLDGITEAMDVTASEWAIIAPLFKLYVERENAVVVENSRVQGFEPAGRSSSEVASAIEQYELNLPQLAYVEPAFVVGYPAV